MDLKVIKPSKLKMIKLLTQMRATDACVQKEKQNLKQLKSLT